MPKFDAGQHYYKLEDVVKDFGFDPALVDFEKV